jgi:hypothetical protein
MGLIASMPTITVAHDDSVEVRKDIWIIWHDTCF